ncbi:MAG: hypothetical protein ACO3AD_18925 [Burkholderiaceae bacterium]
MYDPDYEEIIIEFDTSINGIDVTVRYEQGVDPDDYSDVVDPRTGKECKAYSELWDRSTKEEREEIRQFLRDEINSNENALYYKAAESYPTPYDD